MIKLFKVFLAMLVILSSVESNMHIAKAATDPSTFEEITSEDEIIPGMRYIIVAEVQSESETEPTYKAISTSNSQYGSYGYRGAVDVSKNEDGTITINSSYVLKIRMKPYNLAENKYYFYVEDGKKLFPFCSKSSHNYDGSCCSKMVIAQSSNGSSWWQLTAQETGDWMIASEYPSKYLVNVILYSDGAGMSGFKAKKQSGLSYVDDLEPMVTNIHLYREICQHQTEDVKHYEGIEATCNNAGVLESYYCSNCNRASSDDKFENTININDRIVAPLAHEYENDVCKYCSSHNGSEKFVLFDDGESSLLTGKKLIIATKYDNKYYALGNESFDGKRNAVEIKKLSNGSLEASMDAEFFVYDFDSYASYLADGAALVMMNNQLVTIPPSVDDLFDYNRLGFYLPYYEEFGYISSWDNTNKKTQYLTFVPGENPYFTVTNEESEFTKVNFYIEECKHNNLFIQEAVEPTCYEQGIKKYAYCEDCYNYYLDADMTKAPIEYDGYIMDLLLRPATGHLYDENDECVYCCMDRPVYSQVSTLEQFDQLSENASYIIVYKVGDKTYASSLPLNPCETDLNNNGVIDVLDIDENENNVPDCLEDKDTNYDDILDYTQDMNEDGLINNEDYLMIYDYCMWEIEDYYWQLLNETKNFVEVPVANDGTITLHDEGALEPHLMVAGVWGGQENNKDEYEYENVTEADRIRAMWIPNLWIACDGMLGYYEEGFFMTQNREFGDRDYPGIIDNHNWKISFREDGSACLVSSWTSYDDTGCLQLVKYKDYEDIEQLTVGGLAEEHWEYSDIFNNKIETYPAYLYASEAVYSHTHEWDEGRVTLEPTDITEGKKTYTCTICGNTKDEPIAMLEHTHSYGNWIKNEDELNHYRKCRCGDREYEDCTWDDGVVTVEPTEDSYGEITKTCTVCGNTYISSLEKLPHTHKFGEWIENGVYEDLHFRECQCGEYETGDCTYNEGTILVEPTEDEYGQKEVTCTLCGRVKTIRMDKLPHEHRYGDWMHVDGMEQHYQQCRCGDIIVDDCKFDNGEVILEPTCDTEGTMEYTCTICEYTKTESISPLGHRYDEEGNCTVCQDEKPKVEIEFNPGIIIPEESADEKLVTNIDTILNDIVTNQMPAGIAEDTIETIKTAIEDDATISIISTVNMEEKQEEEIDSEIILAIEDTTPNGTMVQYLDLSIDLDVYVDEELVQEDKLTELKEPMTFTLPIPEELLEVPSGYARTYYIVRVHNGVAEKLPVTVNGDGTISFETDRFSIYALVYEDTVSVLYGDINNDGKVNSFDRNILARYIANWDGYDINNYNAAAADVNLDGKINSFDRNILARHIAAWDGYETLPYK